MPQTVRKSRTKQSIEAQLSLADRVLRGIHKSINEQIERARDLEVQRALALHKIGKNPIVEGDDVFVETRLRLG